MYVIVTGEWGPDQTCPVWQLMSHGAQNRNQIFPLSISNLDGFLLIFRGDALFDADIDKWNLKRLGLVWLKEDGMIETGERLTTGIPTICELFFHSSLILCGGDNSSK